MSHMIGFEVCENRTQILPLAENFARKNVDRLENPFGRYHGQMTILDNEPPLENYEAAVNFLDKMSRGKFYHDYAVRYYEVSEKALVELNKAKNLYAKIKKENAPHNKKSKFVACPVCKSRLSTEHMSETKTTCPLCKASLLSPTVERRLLAAKKRIQKKEAEAKDKKNRKIMWCVKIEVHC